jgi:hypothetical protein
LEAGKARSRSDPSASTASTYTFIPMNKFAYRVRANNWPLSVRGTGPLVCVSLGCCVCELFGGGALHGSNRLAYLRRQ